MTRTTTPANAKKWHQLFEKSDHILLSSPCTPDGDSIGAQIAMREMILGHWRKKKVYMYHEEEVAPRFHCLTGAKQFFNRKTVAQGVPMKKIDVCVVLDGGKERVGTYLLNLLPESVQYCQVDHHVVEGGYPYRLRWCDSRVSSTGELVYQMIVTKPFETSKLTMEMAKALYVSVIFDTGFFRHDCTSPDTLRMAAELYAKKIPFSDLAEKCMLLGRFEAKRLLGFALSNHERHFDGKVILTSVNRDELKQAGAIEDDRDGIVEQVFLTNGVEVGIFLFELDAKTTKASFRSRTDFDVASFARGLAPTGGGHRKASGCTIKFPMDKAKEAILNSLSEFPNFQ